MINLLLVHVYGSTYMALFCRAVEEFHGEEREEEEKEGLNVLCSS